MEEGPEKQALIKLIANHLKKSFLTWSRDSVSDEEIAAHLEVLSKGKLKLTDNIRLSNTTDILSKQKRKKFQGKPSIGKSHNYKGKKN